MEKVQLKDVFRKNVNEGDEVVILVKEYGYRKLKDAYLGNAIYVGQGPYGYEFVDKKDYKKYQDGKKANICRFKSPECVLIKKKEETK